MADPSTSLRTARAAIDAGDAPALVAALAQLSDRQRRDARDGLRDRLRERWRLPEVRRDWGPLPSTLDLLIEAGTAKASEVGWGWWWRLPDEPSARATALALATDMLAARPASIHRAIVRAVCEVDGGSPAAWPVLRALEQRGVLPDVEEPVLAVGLVRAMWSLRPAGLAELDPRDPPDDFLVHVLAEDPSLAPLVLRAVGHPPALDAAHGPWVEWIASAADAGALPRAEVLSTALRTLDGDVRPSTAHLLRKLVTALAPSDDELAAHEPDLVRILADAHPSAQGQAADHLRRLAAADLLRDASAAAGATSRVLTGTQKGAAAKALRLLESLTSDHLPPEEVAARAILGLGHGHEDVQTAAVDLVESLVDGAAPSDVREQALLHLEAVAPALRERVGRLAEVQGLALEMVAADHDAIPSAEELSRRLDGLPGSVVERLGARAAVRLAGEGGVPESVDFAPEDAPPGHPIEPVADAHELGELLRFLLGGSGSPVDLERAIDGIARIDGRSAPAEVTSVVAQQAWETTQHGAGEGAGAAAFLVSLSARDWATGAAPGEVGHLRRAGGRRGLARVLGRGSDTGLLHDLVEPPAATHDFYAKPDGGAGFAGLLGVVQGRLIEAVLTSQTTPRPTLSLPTDAHGWIEAQAFVDRVEELIRVGGRAGRFEAVAALLRLRDPGAVHGQLPRTGAAAPIAAAVDGDADADPALLRATRRHGPDAVGELTLAEDVPHPGLLRTTPWFAVPDPDSWRRDDPTGQLLSEVGERESRHAASWWNSERNVLPEIERLVMGWAPSVVPGSVPLLVAAVARTSLVDPDADRSNSAIDTFVAHAIDPDVPLRHPWHLLLAGTLGAGNRVAGITAADVVATAAEDGRLSASELARHLSRLHAAGVVKLNRVTERLLPMVQTSAAGAAAVRRVGQAWLAELGDLPRDLHHLLRLLESCCDATGAGIDAPGARTLLERASTGRSRRAAAAGRLLDLPATPPDGDGLRVAAAHVDRAERWAEAPSPA